MTSRFPQICIAPLSIAACLLALLACPPTSGWAQTMEMKGGIVSTENTNGNGGYMRVGGAVGTSQMVPMISSYSEWPHYALLLNAFPSALTPQSSYPTYGAFLLRAYGRDTAGAAVSLTGGNLLRLDNNTSTRFTVDYNGKGSFTGGVNVTGTTAVTGNATISGSATISGATNANGGLWASGVQITCERRYKTNIEDAFTTDALTLHASLIPRKFNRIWGENATGEMDASGMASSASGGTSATQEATVVAKDPSWGFIIDELPPQFVKKGMEKGDTNLYLDPLDFVALNTKMIQLQQQTITTLQEKVETLEKKQETKGAILQDASAASLTQVEVEAVADRALVELGLLTEVEVAAADAFESVPETVAVESVETVTRYRYDSATGAVEKFETQATVQHEKPTGQTVRRLKEGVRFDDTTGKFLRLMVAPTTPASETEGLAKLLAPALRARFAAALRASGAPAAARTVSMNLK